VNHCQLTIEVEATSQSHVTVSYAAHTAVMA
jgi:hypothetical protein